MTTLINTHRRVFACLAEHSMQLLLSVCKNDKDFDRTTSDTFNKNIKQCVHDRDPYKENLIFAINLGRLLGCIKQKLLLWTSRDEIWQLESQESVTNEVFQYIQSILHLTNNLVVRI